jgi:hypothetical protein
MPVMDEQKQPAGPVGDHRSKPGWSANKKMDAVLRRLRGEPLDQLSRELGVGGAPPLGRVDVLDLVGRGRRLLRRPWSPTLSRGDVHTATARTACLARSRGGCSASAAARS